jgi:hypothetical protein
VDRVVLGSAKAKVAADLSLLASLVVNGMVAWLVRVVCRRERGLRLNQDPPIVQAPWFGDESSFAISVPRESLE